MLKFLHISDTHIDYIPQLNMLQNKDGIEADRLAGLRQAIAYAKENNIKLIVHSGDVFNITRPPLDIIYEIEKILMEAEALGIEFLIISGNHDQPKIKNSFNALKFLSLRKHVHVSLSPEIYNYENYEFLCVPATREWSKFKTEFPKMLTELLSKTKTNNKILVTHAGITGAKEASTFDIESIFDNVLSIDTIPDIFNYVALGHFHLMQQVDKRKMYYSGSTSQLSFGEEQEEKYFLEVSLDENNNLSVLPIKINLIHKLHTIKINCQNISTITDFNALLKHEIINSKEKIINNIIRIQIVNLNIRKIPVDNEGILKVISPFNPYGVKISISKKDRERHQHDETEENAIPEDIIMSPEDSINYELKRRKITDENILKTNDEVFSEYYDENGIDDTDEY